MAVGPWFAGQLAVLVYVVSLSLGSRWWEYVLAIGLTALGLLAVTFPCHVAQPPEKDSE